MRTMMTALPWFVPGVILAVIVALLIAPAIARALGTRRSVAYLLVVSIGAIIAATIPPNAGGPDWDPGAGSQCDLDGPWLAPMSYYLRITEDSLNVLLFIPLGLALGLLPRSRRTLILIVAVLAIPIAVEATQLLLPVLGRGCELGDVVNNTLGLLLGLSIGRVVPVLARLASGPAGPDQ
jgi:hypothetical protein